jgi:hypothetical protein
MALAGSELAIPTLIPGTIVRDPNFLLGPEKGDQLYTRNARHRIYPSVLIEGASRTPTKQQGHSNFQSLSLPKISTAHDHSLLEN